MANIVSDVETMQRKLEGSWSRNLAEFESRLKAVSIPSNSTLVQLCDKFYAFKELVTSMFALLQQKVSDCYTAIDAIDMRQRRKVLLFNGISESLGADLAKEIVSILKNRLGIVHVSTTHIKRCYRIGIKTDKQARPILVHFQDHFTKSEVWSNKTKLKGSQVSTSEFLTKLRQSVHKKSKKHVGLKNVWTLDLMIYIKLHTEERVKICTEVEIDTLMTKFPIQSFMDQYSFAVARKSQSQGRLTGVIGETKKSRRGVIKK